ncbi:hypothetical protein V1T75_11635 [Tenacibaculum sp. FZY0031]|uniref:DUF4760 domain-containing protein n=1 Tax=Tenacibaculum discolor TaxID=361581 RepID=A0A2G1BXY7_9FLAO|nr:hypothetical protein [Tenacibaculum discolor]MDP2541166.1 hypothetical protein [Tenacibaculum discolor]MEE4000988.1 hypothetical protein [Tenacibaculum sp. FZY0031]PHN98876.1 hypothetical protein CSC81_01440 [Tenacibaculum discolor]PHO01545.1 hypothetical protein CSC82_23135 [Rhodobacteraceae bacterium 4F10]
MDKTLIITILSPILITVGGLITWFFKSKREDTLIAEEKTREFKIKTYETLLEPFITVFTFTLKENQKQKGINKLLSLEYRKAAFNLTTFGSDEVVKSYNNIMQAFFNIKAEDYEDEGEGEEYAVIMLTYLSDLLLNIRKDLYTKKTDLARSEMLAFMINDIEKHKNRIDNEKI